MPSIIKVRGFLAQGKSHTAYQWEALLGEGHYAVRVSSMPTHTQQGHDPPPANPLQKMFRKHQLGGYGCALGRCLGPIEQVNQDIEGNWSLHPGSNGDELITNQPFYHYNYRGKLVEYGGNSPPSSPCKGDVIILYQYPIVNPIVNYTKLVRVVGIAPTYNTL